MICRYHCNPFVDELHAKAQRSHPNIFFQSQGPKGWFPLRPSIMLLGSTQIYKSHSYGHLQQKGVNENHIIYIRSFCRLKSSKRCWIPLAEPFALSVYIQTLAEQVGHFRIFKDSEPMRSVSRSQSGIHSTLFCDLLLYQSTNILYIHVVMAQQCCLQR